jgi:pyocin large subunit-like protein
MRQARIAIGLLLAALLLLAAGPGFRSRAQFDEHFAKHGREFGNISQEEYLRLAQELRDAPAGGSVLEIVKADGVVTRFDRRSGAFGAYNRDRTIRTFFKPNDGERYFRRQANRP